MPNAEPDPSARCTRRMGQGAAKETPLPPGVLPSAWSSGYNETVQGKSHRERARIRCSRKEAQREGRRLISVCAPLHVPEPKSRELFQRSSR
jgi:hypothetical protein